LAGDRRTCQGGHLTGLKDSLGIHGPFIGLDIACADPDTAEIIGKRYAEAVEAAAALGAQLNGDPFALQQLA